MFIGDQLCAKDFEFMRCNKICYVINCAPGEVPNFFEKKAIKYLNIPWYNKKEINITKKIANLVINFIQAAFDE